MLLFSIYTWTLLAGLLCVYWIVRRHIFLRNLVLLGVSIGLYALWSGVFVLLLLAVILGSYIIAFQLQPGRPYRKTLLTLAVLACLCVLAYFKYAGFFLENLLPLLTSIGIRGDLFTAHVLIPLGLSFFLFQTLSYLFDVFAGKIAPTRDIVSYALLIAFFPKIASGPIEQPATLLEQFKKPTRLSTTLLSEGIFLIVWGSIEKFCIADNAALISQKLFESPPQVSLITGALALTLQIFADFSGYSNIAKGIAALLGFELSWNFNLPYISSSPSEFWKRWHMSLSRWFQQYVYIPLGGNRQGLLRTAINLLLTMLLVGLWHGARWTFIVWGLYQGLLLVLYRIIVPKGPKEDSTISLCISVFVFFVLTMIGWVIFQSPSIGSALHAFTDAPLNPFDSLLLLTVLLWLPILLMQRLQYRKDDLLALAHFSLPRQLVFYFIAYYMLMYLPPLQPQQFIYSQF